jgi:hypothetical protein
MAHPKTAKKKPTSTPNKKPSGAKKSGADKVPLSAKDERDALAREAAIIKKLRKDVDKNAWQIGRRLTQIASLDLHKAAKFDKLEDYAQATFGFSRTATFQYMRVAAAFSEELAATFGIEKLDRGLLYIAKTPEAETAKDIPTLHVRVPDAKGAVKQKAFAEVTVPELRAATQHEQAVHGKPKKTKKSADLDPYSKELGAANRALDRAVGASNAARADVTLRAIDGLVLVDVRGVPVGDLRAGLAAVASCFSKKR